MPDQPGRPAAEYSQGERLLLLHDRLLLGERIRPARDGERLGISRRTLERDLAALRRILGARLQSSDLATGRIEYFMPRAQRNFSTRKWQVLATCIGVRMTDFLLGQTFSGEIEPLLDQLRVSLVLGERRDVEGLEKKIHVVGVGRKDYRLNDQAQQQLSTMLDGLLRNKPMRIEYLSLEQRQAGGNSRHLHVHPLCLVLHGGAVYFVVDVVGGDWAGSSRRILLAIDRMVHVQVEAGEERFDTPGNFNPEAFFSSAFGVYAGGAAERIRLLVGPVMAPYVSERFWNASQVLTPQPDGALLLEMNLVVTVEVENWIMGMSPHVEVLAPESLRDRVADRLRDSVAIYGSHG